MFATADTTSGTTVTSFLQTLTLYNAKDQPSRVWMVFFFTIVYSMLGHIFLHFYDEKKKALQVESQNLDPDGLTENQISMHSVLLRGISKNMPLELV